MPSCSARCRASRRSTVMPHTGSSEDDVVDDGLRWDSNVPAFRRPSSRVRARPRTSARPRRTWTSSARIERAISAGVSAPRSRPAGARSAASRSGGTSASSRSHSRTTRGARRRGDEPDVRRLAAQGRRRPPPRPRCPGVATTTYGAASGSRPRMSADAWTRSAPGNASASAIGSMTVTRQPAAVPRRRARRRSGSCRRPTAAGAGTVRFHVDLQRAAGVAGHDQLDDAVAAATLGRPVLREAEQSGLRRRPAPAAPRGRRRAGRSCRRPSPRSSRPGGRCPDAPGRAEVGRRTATTVATANGRPAASSSAARPNRWTRVAAVIGV